MESQSEEDFEFKKKGKVMKKFYKDLGPNGRVLFGAFVVVGVCAVTGIVATGVMLHKTLKDI